MSRMQRTGTFCSVDVSLWDNVFHIFEDVGTGLDEALLDEAEKGSRH